jgi:hypothetical protein
MIMTEACAVPRCVGKLCPRLALRCAARFRLASGFVPGTAELQSSV